MELYLNTKCIIIFIYRDLVRRDLYVRRIRKQGEKNKITKHVLRNGISTFGSYLRQKNSEICTTTLTTRQTQHYFYTHIFKPTYTNTSNF